jgi:glucose-6-phosphate 1-dehydrogenase
MAANTIHPEAVSIIIFGGAGDLSHRKLLPALYNLYLDGLLPEQFVVVGTGRSEMSDDQFRAFAREGVEKFSRRTLDEAKWPSFSAGLFYIALSLGEHDDSFAALGSRLDTVEHERGVPGNRIYYLAVPPSLFGPTVQQLKRARFVGPVDAERFSRLIVEKPIGNDLASAMKINDQIADVFDERQIFRIDHYLGKETVQNILVLRFANSFLEPLFNQRFIDHVQIVVAEAEGVGTRAGYYEGAGALRDMVQNHLLQLLALVAMEPPHSLGANVVRDEKLEVIQALRPLAGEAVDLSVVRGQYAAGVDDKGQPVPGYHDEADVDPASCTETFVALKVFIDNWRWAGVPFLLKTGKRLPKRSSEISIHLKGVPPILFNANVEQPLEPNILTIRIQPDEGFALRISSKVPGPHVAVDPVSMDFTYSDVFGASTPEAYERLLLDVMIGDATLFMRRDQVEASWRWVTPILDRWAALPRSPLPQYSAGAWGPPEAEQLIDSIGRRWRTP